MSGDRRKLAAIMFTDMVGYSALVQRDEARAIRLLDEHRELIRALLPQFGGVEIKTIGDAFLVEFASALDALHCAVEIQKRFTERNASAADDGKIDIRIGLHVGDVIYRDGDVLGDGVNVASRVEALASAGEICVTQQVYDLVRNQFAGRLVSLGAVELKNISGAVNVYRVSVGAREDRQSMRRQRSPRKSRSAIYVAVVIFLLGAIAVWQTFFTRPPDARALYEQAQVLAQHSSHHLEGRENNPRIIALLERAVKTDPNFAEAHAALSLAYVIRLFLYAPQDKELESKAYLEVERALALKRDLPVAYLARGRLKWTPFHHFPHEDAVEDLKHAITLDPQLDEAHHYLGLVYIHMGLLAEGRNEFKAALAVNPSNNGAQYRIGETFFYECKFREARNVFETIDADFNPDLKEYQLGWAMFSLGQRAEASQRLAAYLEKNPRDEGGLLASVQAMMFAASGRSGEAMKRIAVAETRKQYGHFHHAEYNIACAYALMNQVALAVEWLERATRDGFNCYPFFEVDPSLDKVRGDARFSAWMTTEQERFEAYRQKFGRR